MGLYLYFVILRNLTLLQFFAGLHGWCEVQIITLDKNYGHKMASILCNKSSFAGATKVQSYKRNVARSSLVVRAQQESVNVVRFRSFIIQNRNKETSQS